VYRAEIMAFYPRGFLPSLHALAEDFVVCDRWFSPMPGPTWPNRFFVHSGTSLGDVDMPEGIFDPAIHLYDQRTIYDEIATASYRRPRSRLPSASADAGGAGLLQPLSRNNDHRSRQASASARHGRHRLRGTCRTSQFGDRAARGIHGPQRRDHASAASLAQTIAAPPPGKGASRRRQISSQWPRRPGQKLASFEAAPGQSAPFARQPTGGRHGLRSDERRGSA
jgi:hypothetical protein